ncbi:MAG: lipopolysaccharide transport periplasmic protein LptA [Gammaproteobacteria bacterium]|nr:lipopolysaccharide transport periplasmic protein LptA [Gammaproteobacteria bacterium]
MVKYITQYQYLFFVACLFITNTYALTSDRTEAIQFEAGHVTFNDKKGIGTYTRGVSINQGSSHLRADSATTQMDKKHRLMSATAFGSKDERAHFWTSPTVDNPPLHAYADTICYHPLKHELELIGHAYIVQGKNQLTAPHIRYNIKAERFITTAQNNERTVILIDPGAHPEKHL